MYMQIAKLSTNTLHKLHSSKFYHKYKLYRYNTQNLIINFLIITTTLEKKDYNSEEPKCKFLEPKNK